MKHEGIYELTIEEAEKILKYAAVSGQSKVNRGLTKMQTHEILSKAVARAKGKGDTHIKHFISKNIQHDFGTG